MAFDRSKRWLLCAGWVAWLSCPGTSLCRAAVDTTSPAKPRAQKKVITALSPWEQAERGRDTLEAIPETNRTKADYVRAMDAYRAIYHADPRDVHAAAAVNAVAEMLAEQGRGLHDAKASQAAVGQYEFLQKQYPGSSLGVQALLAEGQIEQNDLGDAAAAQEKYTLLLKQHGKSEQAEEARAGLESLRQGTRPKDQRFLKSDVATVEKVLVQPLGSAGGASSLPAMATTSSTAGTAKTHVSDSRRGAPASVATDTQDVASVREAAEVVRSERKAVVSGIRHWSTATYTRVAIDLGDTVTYEAARVPNPDRIYFDLHGTKLAQELVGKSFAVTDDGFLKKIRAAQFSDDMTRVVLDVSDVSEYSAFLLPNPYRLIIDIHGGPAQGFGMKDAGMGSGVTSAPLPRVDTSAKATAAKPVPNTVATKSASTISDVAAVSAMPGRVEATTRPTSKPISAVVADKTDVSGSSFMHREEASTSVADKASSKKSRQSKVDATPARAAVPTADGETSLVRALGLKIGRIVIDAGHGGHDSGTLGADGIEEKDVVLDVALRVGKLLHDRLGAEIIYTRSDDTFIPLETRTAIANKAQADLFLSIHANSSSDASARGVETYYLNFTSDPSALETAARENAVSDQSIHQLSDLVKKIALKDKIAESREFASDVEGSMYAGLQKGNDGLKDRGVKKAPFVVLIGANMPSILAEISFVTNPNDAQQLRDPEYRQRVAESLFKGVARYEGGLSGARAQVERAAGQ